MNRPRLRAEVLGPVRVWLGDTELKLGPARQRAVFAALATRSTSCPMPRAELIEAVWGEFAPASAVGSVHTYISGLRRILEPDRVRWSTDGLLLSDDVGYRLQLADDAVDLRVFNRLHETALILWQDGDAGGTIETLDRALGLWHGEVLSGVPGPHAEALRAELAEQRVAALELRAEALLRQAAHEDLVPQLTVLVREHPLRENLWRLLMSALHACGRTTEALEVFREAREVLRKELGVGPGPELTAVHRMILVNDPALAPAAVETDAVPLHRVLPGRVVHAMARHRDRPSAFYGRKAEITRLRQLVDDLTKGVGHTVWIEGEPGIGKSELLAAAFADVADRGCHVAWGAATELGQSFPLQVLTESLGTPATEVDAEPVATMADQILDDVERLCAQAPLLMVIDDLQWADDASLLLWNRLSVAARRLPLLLVAASRPTGKRADLACVRRTARLRGLDEIGLKPLAGPDTEELIGAIVGGRPGQDLISFTEKAAGNPYFIREVTTALVREQAVEVVDGVAGLRAGSATSVPESLLGAVVQTLARMDDLAREAVRRAAVLGMEFGLAQVAATMGVLPSVLLDAFSEVMGLGIIVDAGTHLAFRHSMFRWALYHEIDGDVRPVWHRRAAEALADAGAEAERVAQQLVAVPAEVDDWVIGWLAENHGALANRAPSLAAVLLRRVLDECGADDPRHEVLLTAYVLVLFRMGQDPFEEAERAMVLCRDPQRAAEMRHVAAAIAHRRGDTRAAVGILEGNDAPETPPLWSQRRRSLVADLRRGSLDDLGRAAQAARRDYRAAASAGEPYPIGLALQTLWLIKSIERDHGAALRYVDRAIKVVDGHRGSAALHCDLPGNRMFTLWNLDRLSQAENAVRAAWRAAGGSSRLAGLRIATAIHRYWTGDWDGALAQLETVHEDSFSVTARPLREPGASALLYHGVAALIHGYRTEDDLAGIHLHAAGRQASVVDSACVSRGLLLVARSVRAEQRGGPEEAIDVLAPILDSVHSRMLLRHQWIPRLIRLARDYGDDKLVTRALAACQEEAMPAGAAAAARWCTAIAYDEPAPGRSPGGAGNGVADVAVLLARAGRRQEARHAVDQGMTHLAGLGARWEIQRLKAAVHRFELDLGEGRA